MRIVQRSMFHRYLLAILLIQGNYLLSAQSVLATGEWYKVGVTQTGIYKLDRTFLTSIGVPATVDPQTIKVYGNGGGMLPQSNAAARPTDLIENAVFASGQSDGKLDATDYFLFYGQSPDRLNWSASGFIYEKNIYSDTAYYFITHGGVNGLRITTATSLAEQPEKITSFDDVILHELDESNILNSGREWFGESLSPGTGNTRNFSYTRANVLALESAELRVVAQSNGNCSMDMLINSQVVGNVPIGSVPFGPGSEYSDKGRAASGIFPLSGANNTINVGFKFNPNGATSISWIDRFAIRMKRALLMSESELHFRSIASLGSPISTFTVGNVSGEIIVWDVTSGTQPIQMQLNTVGSSAHFSTSTSAMKEFVALSGSNFPSPTNFGKVKNQNIQSTTAVDGIIVTHPDFQVQAKRLADFHASHDQLTIVVVTTKQIYNEYSSGKQDVSAIRDYVKHVYQTSGQLRYLLLFGDASYDYKYRGISLSNLVPMYQARESFHPIYSYSSDDYFGFLENNEGTWTENNNGDHTLEIGIGRLPVNTKDQAERIVNKIIRYATSPSSLGKWRNNAVYVSDDGDNNIHAIQAESLAEMLTANSSYTIKKLHLDAFDQVVSPSKEESPSLQRAIIKAIDEGTFLVNFIGHGNEEVWMDERVFNLPTIWGLRNYQRLPIFVTATCQFGRYDNPRSSSGAEILLLSDQGAIALLTTTRLVFAHTNFILNQAFHESMTGAGDRRLGDVIKQTKNNSLSGPVNRNFALLGDPMLRPAFPSFDIELDQFQSVEPTTISALERLNLTGKVTLNGNLVSDFNGKLAVELFDIPVEKRTKGQQNSPMTYFEQDNALYRGEATVVNGQFSLEFIVPRNISYQYQTGKLNLYAWDETTVRDASGESKNFVIGGTNKDAPVDTKSPQLEVYLNEPAFKNGSTVGPGALLIAKFSDESGMNISNSGFDRGITLSLNGQIIELNNFYTADADDFTKGAALYPLGDLTPGKYTAIIKGSDVHNNPVTKSVDFVVSNQPILQTYNFKTYPNPAKTFTQFTFEHDREGESLNVAITLYALNGDRAIESHEIIPFSERNVEIKLDLSGRVPKDGMYVYRVVVQSLADGAVRELTGRLVIGN